MLSVASIREELRAAGLTVGIGDGKVFASGPHEAWEKLFRPAVPEAPAVEQAPERTGPPLPLSRQQRAALDTIKRLASEKGYSPSVREIGAAMGLTSTSTVHAHLTALVNKGYIRYGEGPRRLRILNG